MRHSDILSRLKALESTVPTDLVLLVEDKAGNRFECSVSEYEQHAPDGWDFKKVVSGCSLSDAHRVLVAWALNTAF